MRCKLCLEDKPLIKAHIILRSFFEAMGPDSKLARLRSNKVGTHPARCPIGIYSTDILCESCERIFSPWDTYAISLLVKGATERRVQDDDQNPIAFQYDSFDYAKLKLFFLSVLWRADASTHRFFAKVKLGPHEPVLREMIRTGNPGDSEDYAITLAKFDHVVGKAILDPHRERYDDVNYIRLYLAGYVAYVKVDSRPAPGLFGRLKMDASAPLVVVLRNLARSPDLRIIKSIVNPGT